VRLCLEATKLQDGRARSKIEARIRNSVASRTRASEYRRVIETLSLNFEVQRQRAGLFREKDEVLSAIAGASEGGLFEALQLAARRSLRQGLAPTSLGERKTVRIWEGKTHLRLLWETYDSDTQRCCYGVRFLRAATRPARRHPAAAVSNELTRASHEKRRGTWQTIFPIEARETGIV